MINDENLEKLYVEAMSDNEITTNKMNSYGFTTRDLTQLVRDGTIERIKRGYYSLKDINKLFFYGKKLISLNRIDEATLCFEKCFELDSTHLGACFQLFLKSIQKEDYKRTFELLEFLNKTDNKYYKIDYNFYLFLLSYITVIPDKYKDYIKKMSFKDIEIPLADKRYQDILLQNKIRENLIQQKFALAFNQVNEMTKKRDIYTVHDKILKLLLTKVINNSKLSKDIILNFIRNSQYDELINYLKAKQDNQKLSILDEYTLKLAIQYVEMKKTSKVLDSKNIKSEYIFDLIDANHFTKALEINIRYIEKFQLHRENNVLNLLLTDICNLINCLRDKDEDKMNNEKLDFNESDYNETYFSNIVFDTLRLKEEQINNNVKEEYTARDKKSTINIQKVDSEQKLVTEKHKELVNNGGIILLKAIDDDRLNRILSLVSNYEDIIAFVIGEGKNRQIVLRYKLGGSEKLDIKQLTELGHELYLKQKYNECNQLYLKLLRELIDEPKSYVYFRLGLINMKLKNKQLAIDYFTVASFVAKKELASNKLSSNEIDKISKMALGSLELLLKLKGEIPSYDKPKVKMKEEDFNYYDVSQFYGIDNFDEINTFIMSSGLDVESACIQLGMSSEQIDIVKLIYAREFYLGGLFQHGDIFLNSVEKSKNKTKYVIKLLNDIRKNRRFYQNREGREPKKLSLSILHKKDKL